MDGRVSRAGCGLLAQHLLDQLLGHQHAVLALSGHLCGVRVEHLGANLFKGLNEFSQPKP